MGTRVWSGTDTVKEAIGGDGSHCIYRHSWWPWAGGLAGSGSTCQGRSSLRGHWLRSWAQAANGWAELGDGWDAGSMRHGTIRTLLLVAGTGRGPLTAGPLVSATAGSIQCQGDAGGHRWACGDCPTAASPGLLLGSSWLQRQKEASLGPERQMVPGVQGDTFRGFPCDHLQLWMPSNDWLFSSQLASRSARSPEGRRGVGVGTIGT